jgi:hypothetical protein
MDRTLERIERVRLTVASDLEGVLVVISADVAGFHRHSSEDRRAAQLPSRAHASIAISVQHPLGAASRGTDVDSHSVALAACTADCGRAPVCQIRSRHERPVVEREDDTMMHEHDRNNGYGRQMRYDDDRHQDEYRSRDDYGDRGGDRGRDYGDRGREDDHEPWSDRDSRMSRFDEESMPFSRRETPRRLLGNTVASVWEITAQSRTSFEDAIRYGIERARRTLRHIRGAWVQGQEVLIRNNEIYAYRVQLKVTYVLDDT